MLFYSPSTNYFYDSDVHKVIPDDRVSVSSEEHAACLDAQSKGHIWAAGENGKPVVVGRPGPTVEEQQAALALQAKALLAKSDITVLKAYEQGRPVPAPFVAYREALRAVVNGQRNELPSL